VSGWIKFEKSLQDDPRVIRLASRLRNASVATGDACALVAMGALTRLWCYADTHIRDDNTLDMGFSEIDALIGVPGFCSMMPADWLREISENTVELPDFQAHNGVDAKKRALSQKRMQRMRDAKSVTRASTRASPDQDQTKTKKRPRPKRGSGGDPEQVIENFTVPIGLDLAAWDRWLKYRKHRKPPIRPESIQAAADELTKFGEQQAAVVQQSIANGWQGLFPLKLLNGSAPHPEPRKTRYEQSREALERATEG
jgi:hypothetical protein